MAKKKKEDKDDSGLLLLLLLGAGAGAIALLSREEEPTNGGCDGCDGQADGTTRAVVVTDSNCPSGEATSNQECDCDTWVQTSRECVPVAPCVAGSTRTREDLSCASGLRNQTCNVTTGEFVDGECVPIVCTDGETRCNPTDPNTLQECVGGSWESVMSCAFGCSGGVCNPPICSPEGINRCDPTDSNVRQQCIGGNWMGVENCAFGCSGGVCNPPSQLCTAGTRRCNGSDVEECSADGMAWNPIMTCAWGCSGNSCNSQPLWDVTCTVEDTATSGRISGARVEIVGFDADLTNSSGVVVFNNVPQDTYTFRISGSGYEPEEQRNIVIDRDRTLAFSMRPTPANLQVLVLYPYWAVNGDFCGEASPTDQDIARDLFNSLRTRTGLDVYFATGTCLSSFEAYNYDVIIMIGGSWAWGDCNEFYEACNPWTDLGFTDTTLSSTTWCWRTTYLGATIFALGGWTSADTTRVKDCFLADVNADGSNIAGLTCGGIRTGCY